MQVDNIINSISILSEKLFKSVEGQVYNILDDIILIGPDILKSEPLNKIFFPNDINWVILIANSLTIFYSVYYILSRILSMYNGSSVESVYNFILKLVIVLLLVNNSYYICEEILNFNEIVSETIDEAIYDLLGKEATFKNLKEEVISLQEFVESDALSLEGIIKSILSFFSVSLLITFSIRYVTVILLIILSPLALVCLTSNITRGITKSFGKILFINLVFQLFIKLLLVIPMLYSDKDNTIYKIILIGSMYMIYRLNNFVRELLSQIHIPSLKER